MPLAGGIRQGLKLAIQIITTLSELLGGVFGQRCAANKWVKDTIRWRFSNNTSTSFLKWKVKVRLLACDLGQDISDDRR